MMASKAGTDADACLAGDKALPPAEGRIPPA